ncbi:MAG: transcription initiation factor IIB family protein [Candidatus Heimdallarchaeota archaeon]
MNAVYVNKIVSLCPECGGNIISIQETGDILCNQCGLVIQEKSVDFSHNGRRAYSTEEKSQRERTGSPISGLVPDIGLTTTIDRKKINNPDLKRAAKWDTRMTWEKRNLLIATTELKRIANNLNLPNHVKEEAMRLYKEVFRRKLLRGRSINSMIAASLYYSVRKYKVSRTLHEILKETAEKDKNVRRCYRVLIRELNLKAPNTKPINLVPRYIAELGLSSEIETIATKIVKLFTSNFGTSGKDPKGIVGGAIYISCKLKGLSLTQKQIADLIGITEVTLRSRYKEITQKLKIKFD